jgi:hypothetical protein
LALKNYRAALRDAGSVIAICTQEKLEVPKKALFRAAQALIALERWTEAKDVVQRGLEGNAEDKAWKELEGKVELGIKRVMERKERERRDVLSKKALKEAISVCLILRTGRWRKLRGILMCRHAVSSQWPHHHRPITPTLPTLTLPRYPHYR